MLNSYSYIVSQMRLIIIDDQTETRSKLKMLVQSFFDDKVKIVAEAEGVNTGEKAIRLHQPDLVLLDVEMEDGTGFQLLERFPTPTFKVIFITAHDKYAIKAFKYSAMGYVLKPIDFEDLVTAVQKVEVEHIRKNQLAIQTLLQNQHQTFLDKKLILSDSENIYLIALKEIIRCEAESNYTRFFLTEDRELFITKTLKEYSELLDSSLFFQAHRSHIINLSFFNKLEKKDGGTIYLKGGSTVPIAHRRREDLFAALKRL